MPFYAPEEDAPFAGASSVSDQLNNGALSYPDWLRLRHAQLAGKTDDEAGHVSFGGSSPLLKASGVDGNNGLPLSYNRETGRFTVLSSFDADERDATLRGSGSNDILIGDPGSDRMARPTTPNPKGEGWWGGAADFAGNVLRNPDTYRGIAEIIGGGFLSAAGAGGVAGSGVAEGGSAGLASPVALPAAAVSAGAVVTGAAITADGAKTLGVVFNKASDSPGSYTNTHESGRTYSGKGPRERSQISGRRVERETGDRHLATDWRPSESDQQAFQDEAQRIMDSGGAKSSKNYNKIESPGKKYLENK